MNGNCIVDGNIVEKYFLADISTNLIDLDFYIASKCNQLLLNDDIQRIIKSFKMNSFFVNHHWTNVKCFFDPTMSYQHLSSNKIIKLKLFDGIM